MEKHTKEIRIDVTQLGHFSLHTINSEYLKGGRPLVQNNTWTSGPPAASPA